MVIQLRKQVAKKNPAVAPMVPETMHNTVELPFSNGVFAINVKQNKSSKGGIQIQMGTGNGRRVVNLKTGSERSECVFNNHSYYTEKTASGASINYSSDTKKIAGYTCSKAIVTTADKTQYTVWYTTAIPYAYNPEGIALAGVKGAVLEYSNDETACTAVSVKSTGFTPASVAVDAKAKKISSEQMQDLQEEAATTQARAGR